MIDLGMIRLKGEYRMVLYEADGKTVVQDTGWKPNLITDFAFTNWHAKTSPLSNFNIGSSNQAPAVTDTTLYGWLADSFGANELTVMAGAPNHEAITTKKARFNAGSGTGTIREFGCNNATDTNNTKMMVRTLVTPEVVKSADQVLDVFHRMTRYPDLVDRTGTVSIEGVSYDYIVRGAYLDDGSTSGFNTYDAYAQMGISTGSSDTRAFTDDIQGVTSGPQVSISNPWSGFATHADLGAGTGYVDTMIPWALDNANGSIRSFHIRERGHGTSNSRGWQVRVGKTSDDSPLVKDNTKEMELDFRVTYGRYP